MVLPLGVTLELACGSEKPDEEASRIDHALLLAPDRLGALATRQLEANATQITWQAFSSCFVTV